MLLTVTLNASVDKCYQVETLSPHAVMRVSQVRNSAGGKGLNVSRTAAIAGEPVIAMGMVGGYNGQLLESLLTQPKIQKHFTHVKAETRCCINILDTQTGNSTELLEPGSQILEEEISAFLQNFESALTLAKAVVLSGSLPQGVPSNFYGELIQRVHHAGRLVLLDTSGIPLKAALKAQPDFIKPNIEELHILLGRKFFQKGELADAAESLRRTYGIGTVAISLGADGVLVSGAEGVFHGQPPVLDVLNTVGCGDSMVAGFAIGLLRGWSMEKQIRFATAISAANALTLETGSFHPTDLARILPQVTVQKI